MSASSNNEQEALSSFRKALAASKNVIIVAGAGIPTYRGLGGFWLNFAAFKENLSKVAHRSIRRSYTTRRCLDAEPNAAHHALATFCLPLTLAQIAPSLDPKWPARSSRSPACSPPAEKCILEMHGCIFETRCTSCAHVQRSYTPTPCSDALDKAPDPSVPLPIDQLPRCGGANCTINRYGRCGGLLRPNVVWFGEVPQHMGEIAKRMNWCDLLLLVGTSTTVYPAAGFAKTVKERGGKIAMFKSRAQRRRGSRFHTLPLALAV
ncbi:sirtuin [Mycena maculata]|uniref:Sirtuin n=1 Tax=Mycena maculata TaxID=230809 RepID=A0AAD7KA86_9AGAR|nr:sirtuin [Mycena maculata]